MSSERLTGKDAIGFQSDGHFVQGQLVNLRDTAFVDAQNAANFLHRHLSRMVEYYHFAVPLRKRSHGVIQHRTQLPAGADGIGPALRTGGEIRRRKLLTVGGTR